MRAGRGAARSLWAAGFLLLAGCTAAPPGVDADAAAARYAHNRDDYAAFRARHPGLLEPNYLPFMAWRVEARPPGAAALGWLPRWLGGAEPLPLLVFCHWRPEDFPLAVHVEAPVLPAEEEDDLRPVDAGEYRAAVDRALDLWQRDLEGAVAFRRVARSEDATLRIRLLGGRSPFEDPEREVLGTTRIGGGCEARGGDPASGRIDVRFRVRELRVFLADQHGLLLADQVEKVALHEIGHALGMPDHSPIPADLMFPVAPDRLPREGLGMQDVNSFLSLYALPSGTVYHDLTRPSAVTSHVPEGPPRLEVAPHVDARLGFELQPPRGWTRIPTPYGVVLVDGLTWDHEVSLQVVVRRFDTLDEYLGRHGPAHMRRSRVRAVRDLRLAGRPAKRIVLETPRDTVEELTFLETGDGRVLVTIAESQAATWARWSPWFAASLSTLDLTTTAPTTRDYGDVP